jgi:DNA polymerase V
MDERGYTGFPSPAEEYRRPALNLHQLLAPRPLSTFFARFAGDPMVEANICDQDLLVIERLNDYSSGQIVVLRQNSIHVCFQQLRLSFSQPKFSRSKLILAESDR